MRWEVRPYEATMEVALSKVFGDAFHDDPIFEFMLGAGERHAQTRWVCRQGIRMPARFGYATVAGEPLAGGAFWVPPGESPNPPLWLQVRLGNLGVVRHVGLAKLPRILARESSAERKYRRFLTEPHWVLDFVAVNPALQGRGLGGALLRPMLTRIDEERLPAFLLTYNPSNVGFYRAHGFEVVDERTDGPVPVCFSMRRPARTST